MKDLLVLLAVIISINNSSFAHISPIGLELLRTELDHLNMKNVYGKDDRVLVENYRDLQYVEYAKSIAAMVPAHSIIDTDRKNIKRILELDSDEKINLCEGEKFKNLPSVSECSGFLVKKDIILTAGHCVRDVDHCSELNWVFNYRKNIIGADNFVYGKKKNIYKCKKILAKEDKREYKYYDDTNDFALVQLDRDVTDRKPLPYNRSFHKIEDGAELVIIGHPMGYPMMIADNARVRDNSYQYFFTANLDAFNGNSGSPVFNKSSGLVEGVLSRGEYDFIYNFEKRCYKVKKCTDEGCRGDLVTRINVISEILSYNNFDIYLSGL